MQMTLTQVLLLAALVAAALYAVAVIALIVLGRRSEARALARFIPDCLVLLRRLLRDPKVARRRKLVLIALVAYLAMPIDLVPDFVPVAGQLDDVIIAAFALRYALRAGGADLLREHWPGPDASLNVVIRVAYGGPFSQSYTGKES
jgi:uncharacterized membrane protein YkvA (DUF1232 family)